MKKTWQAWDTHPSGILVPTGQITDRRDKSRATFLEIKWKAEEIETLYRDNELTLPGNCELAQLICWAKDISDKWLLNAISELDPRMIFSLCHLLRLAESVLPLKDEPNITNHLKALTSGPIDFFKRERSHAKDIFWELEVCSKLRKRFKSVKLEEPPDVVVKFEQSRIGIACKKLYSEKHVQNVLSEAVHQIEGSFDIGIVALNLDDFVPADKYLKATDHEGMTKTLTKLNTDFIQRHERHFRTYLEPGRLISAVVSTAVIAEVANAIPPVNNASQWNVWTIPGLDPKKSQCLDKFYEIVMT